MLMFAILVSVLSGIAIVFGRIFNSKMAEKMGLFQGALLNYIAGLVVSIMLLLITGGLFSFSSSVYNAIPVWAYFGGILGVAIVVLSSYLTPRISVFYLTVLIFIGQLITGLIVDYFISGVLPIGKILGGVFVLIGFLYNLNIDYKKNQNIEEITLDVNVVR